MYHGKFYFEDSSFKLIENDTFKTLTNFEEKTFDMIFAESAIFFIEQWYYLQWWKNGKCQ